MVTSNLIGGLGNYMFQISAAYSLCLDNGDELIYNIRDRWQVHKPIENYTNNILSKINFIEENLQIESQYQEPYFHFKKIPYNKNLRINGYFQSEKYFIHNKEKILNLFSIDEESKNLIDKKYSKILEKNTCSLHVRRGDYLNLPNHHPSCSLEYYLESINQFEKDTLFLIFSDDLDWCKENFKGENFIFIEGNEDYIDLWTMSLCKNNIIANSTFSWWGAWLNTNPTKKVLCPSVWFGNSITNNTIDLMPKTWKII
jgi:hypothetical protein